MAGIPWARLCLDWAYGEMSRRLKRTETDIILGIINRNDNSTFRGKPMGPIAEKLLLMLISQLLTPELIKKFEVYVVQWLWQLAQSSDNKVDDAMVRAIAEALGVKLEDAVALPHNNS